MFMILEEALQCIEFLKGMMHPSTSIDLDDRGRDEYAVRVVAPWLVHVRRVVAKRNGKLDMRDAYEPHVSERTVVFMTHPRHAIRFALATASNDLIAWVEEKAIKLFGPDCLKQRKADAPFNPRRQRSLA